MTTRTRTRTTTTTETTTTSSAGPSRAVGRPDPGAAGAFIGELFAAHGRMVLGLCRLLLRDPVEAEDATQQVFLSAHRAMLGGSGPRDPSAWLAAIARNECRARIRARMREPLAVPELPSDLPDPLASAIRTVDLDALRDALASLPRRQRRAFLLRELGGLSYGEVGRALGISQSAVESLLFRARQQLRTLLSGANAAAVPLALRDDLARLIPGFDPGSAGFVARLATLPVAAKLATAAVGVGVVATGAAEPPRDHSHRVGRHASPAAQIVVRPELRERFWPEAAAERPERLRGGEREAPAGTPSEPVDEDDEAREVEHERAEVERGPAEPVEIHEFEEREGHDASETDGADD